MQRLKVSAGISASLLIVLAQIIALGPEGLAYVEQVLEQLEAQCQAAEAEPASLSQRLSPN